MKWQSFAGIVLAWASIGLVHGLSRYADIIKYNVNANYGAREVVGFILSYMLWVLITLIIMRALHGFRYPFAYRSVTALFVGAATIWIPFYFVSDYLISVLLLDNTLADMWKTLKATSISVVFYYFIVYILTFAACLGLVLSEKTASATEANARLIQQKTQTELLLSEQRMKLMQSQLSPHVLFNCLGAISALGREGERERLIQAIATVGNLLRFTLVNASEKTIALFDELALVEDYIALQRLRFEDKFQYQANIGQVDGNAMCPPFTIQPLLENAFKHGVESSESGVSITLNVNQQENRIMVNVENTLPDKHTSVESTGTGIDNLRHRLTHLYDDEFTLTAEVNQSRYIASVSFPARPVQHDI